MHDASDGEKYLAAVPEPAQTTLREMRERIRRAAPKDAEETIRYGMPAFRSQKKLIAGYAAFPKHCGYFPMSGSVIETLGEELQAYKTAKGSIQFALDKPLPVAL